MKTPEESEPSHHLKTFKDLLRLGKESLEILFNNPADYDIREDHGIHTIRIDFDLKADYKNKKKGVNYHTNLCRLHDIGLLIVSEPNLLKGRLRTKRKRLECRQIPQIHFLIARDIRSERFIHNLRSNPMLDVCVRDSRNDSTNKVIETGTFYEEVVLYKNEEIEKWRTNLEEFSCDHDPKEDPEVFEILQNENPYYCSVGMKISETDYFVHNRETFIETTRGIDLAWELILAMATIPIEI